MLAPVEVGQKAPNFTLSDDRGQSLTLSSLLGKPVVLYFYPRDNTPGCTREACAFRDRRAELARRGARVLGVSTDSVASHARFRDQYQLNFPLLADPQHVVAETYGAWAEKTLYGKKSWGLLRSTFLIDAEGVVRRIWRKVLVDGHDDAVLDALDDLTGGSGKRTTARPPSTKAPSTQAPTTKTPSAKTPSAKTPSAKVAPAVPAKAVSAKSPAKFAPKSPAARQARRATPVAVSARPATKKATAATKRRTGR